MTEGTQNNWLVGGRGLFRGAPEWGWEPVGNNRASALALLRRPGEVLLAAHSGLWVWRSAQEYWTQLHDETLTEVLALAAVPDNPGLLAASPYGIATARMDELGALRWTFPARDLRVNERFSNALLVDPAAPDRWLVGTESGVLVADEQGRRWQRTGLSRSPVRALLHAFDSFWAGTDHTGIWRSRDGLHWERAGTGLEEGAVYSLATAGDRLLAGTTAGVVAGDGRGRWLERGPRLPFACAAAHPHRPEHWLAGASPGGLWHSEDSGQSWRQSGSFTRVRALLPPETH